MKKRINRKKIGIVLAAAAIAVGACIGTVYAKYMQTMKLQAESEKKAVFVSDYLKEKDAISDCYPEYHIYDGSVEFTICNFVGEVRSELEIDYTLSLTGNYGDLDALNGADEELLVSNTGEAESWKLTGSKGNTVTVEAVASGTVSRTIGATFVFLGDEQVTKYVIEDKTDDQYITLKLYTGAVLPIGGITIRYGNSLIPDNANSLMRGWVNVTEGELTGLTPNAYYELIFFEKTDADRTKGETLVRNDEIVLEN